MAELCKQRAIYELHQRMHNALGMHHHVDFFHRQIEQPSGFDHLQALVEESGRVDGNLTSH